MSSFEANAVVGRACVLPGAQSPPELRDLVVAGKAVASPLPAGAVGARAGERPAVADQRR